MKMVKYYQIILIILIFSIVSTGENYLIICHEDIYSSGWYNKLYNLKVNQGYSVSYVDVEDGDDVGTVKGIIDYVNPDYVLLIGDASEYPDNAKQTVSAPNENYMPFCYTAMYCSAHPNNTSDLIPNDEWYLSYSTETCIGRVPANSVQEVECWVDKLIEEAQSYAKYEGWKNKILLTTGNMDHPSNGCRGIYRNMERDTLIARYIEPSDMDYITLNSADYGSGYFENQSVRAEDFEDEVNAGCSFINAIGVGADDNFLVNFYFSDSDYSFNNSGKYPFLLGMSCYVGRIQRFTDENIESVIQKLMFLEDGGLVD